MRDLDVRTALLSSLADEHAEDGNTLIVQEMGIWSGAVRIDVAVINGELSGFELKSDRDTLLRLPAQADLYSRVFDRMTLVVGTRHSAKAIEIVPEWWGIVGASMEDAGQVRLEAIRSGSKNEKPEPYLVAQLLWKAEAIAILAQYGLAQGWRTKPIKLIHQRLAAELPLDVLSLHVRATLKSRISWLGYSISNERQVSV